ncbi:hypothetical protein GCM10010417_26480 [Streptomyces carpaticus]
MTGPGTVPPYGPARGVLWCAGARTAPVVREEERAAGVPGAWILRRGPGVHGGGGRQRRTRWGGVSRVLRGPVPGRVVRGSVARRGAAGQPGELWNAFRTGGRPDAGFFGVAGYRIGRQTGTDSRR